MLKTGLFNVLKLPDFQDECRSQTLIAKIGHAAAKMI